MQSEWIDLSTPDGPMRTYVVRPEAEPGAGIVVFQEAYGVNDHVRDVAGRFAQLGLVAVAPELFHRTSRGFDAPYDTDGSWASIEPHYKALTTKGLSDDARAAYDFIAAGEGLGVVANAGFCMGGRASYVANARAPFAAAISFYGGGIVPDLLDLAPKQSGPILMFWGGLDANIKPEQYRSLADAIDDAGKTHEQVVFSQAGHGFFCDQRKSYNAQAAEQAWALSVAFLRAYKVID
ncbi:MAG TPA: dienelactone hydrolase family protein [Candidatus Baltobacteraceae bacterium]|jgi:carboxymethylenebutenolidase|nr:dienelactone hydrolase family protein [Candidatus Baltobacteraceae bacterium]